MDLTNLSTTPSSKLRPLIRFVAARAGHKAALVLYNHVRRRPTAGLTWEHGLVQLWLTRNLRYPKVSAHENEDVAARCGEIVFESWEEEFLYVLAHEWQHVDDFATNRAQRNEFTRELSAEQAAVKALAAWRKKQGKRPISRSVGYLNSLNGTSVPKKRSNNDKGVRAHERTEVADQDRAA